MNIVHISSSCRESVVDANGKTWLFDWHAFLGPTVLTKAFEPRLHQPGPRSPFWPALALWQERRRASAESK